MLLDLRLLRLIDEFRLSILFLIINAVVKFIPIDDCESFKSLITYQNLSIDKGINVKSNRNSVGLSFD
jgi:hypothetical protein